MVLVERNAKRYELLCGSVCTVIISCPGFGIGVLSTCRMCWTREWENYLDGGFVYRRANIGSFMQRQWKSLFEAKFFPKLPPDKLLQFNGLPTRLSSIFLAFRLKALFSARLNASVMLPRIANLEITKIKGRGERLHLRCAPFIIVDSGSSCCTHLCRLSAPEL